MALRIDKLSQVHRQGITAADVALPVDTTGLDVITDMGPYENIALFVEYASDAAALELTPCWWDENLQLFFQDLNQQTQVIASQGNFQLLIQNLGRPLWVMATELGGDSPTLTIWYAGTNIRSV